MAEDYRSARFALPLLAMGQAQKELTHNEALAALDALLHPVIVASDVGDPPVAAVPGEAWIVPADASGEWAEESGKIAFMTSGGWRYSTPVAGMQIWVDGTRSVYADGGWSDAPDYAAPSGGAVIDTEARTALSTIAHVLAMSGIIVQA